MKTSASGHTQIEQSILMITELIEAAQHNLKKDAVLIILWGWIMTLSYAIYFMIYYYSQVFIPFQARQLILSLPNGLMLLGIAFTIYYVYRRQAKVRSYISIAIRTVWFSLIGGWVLINLILFNVLQELNLQLQHPIFMVLTAFATVVSGAILRYQLLIIGGILFGFLAWVASFLELPTQLIFESIAWLVAFVIPGHVLYAGRNK